MTETKPWYESRTVWAGIVTSVMGVLSVFGIVPVFDATIIDELVTSLMGLAAIWGRLIATKEITPVLESE